MKLGDLDHLRNNKQIRFAEETINDETVTIVCYMVASHDLWDIPYAKECRGIVFNSQGACVSRPLHKFHNVGEREDTQVHNLPELTEILEKRDGSLLVPVLVGGKIAWKTKKSFYSEVAVEASKHVPENITRFSHWMVSHNFTPIFEYTSPFNKIVLDYGPEPKFVLLAIRHNSTGRYQEHHDMLEFAGDFGIEVIQKYDLALEDCLKQSKILENFEGWCLRNPTTGFYVKQKTEWYLRNHRAQTELRERDVADMVIAETIDDIKSALAIDGFDLAPIEEIERFVVQELSAIRGVVESFVAKIEDKTNFKQIASDFKDRPMFSLIMSYVRGKEPDYKRYWINNHRENYSLKGVYNKNF